jgi:1,4-dihydroxy-2-naphthoyl-CoA hydrolase
MCAVGNDPAVTDTGTALAALLAAGGDIVEILNEHRSAFDRAIGLVFTRIGLHGGADDEVAAEIPVTAALLQPYGLVHGGVYATIVETLASTGAALSAMPRGHTTVGLENATSFLRGTRDGTLHARATPLHRGTRTQVWAVEIRDDAGREVANGRVRMLCLEVGASVAGETVTIQTSRPDQGR